MDPGGLALAQTRVSADASPPCKKTGLPRALDGTSGRRTCATLDCLWGYLLACRRRQNSHSVREKVVVGVLKVQCSSASASCRSPGRLWIVADVPPPSLKVGEVPGRAGCDPSSGAEHTKEPCLLLSPTPYQPLQLRSPTGLGLVRLKASSHSALQHCASVSCLQSTFCTFDSSSCSRLLQPS